MTRRLACCRCFKLTCCISCPVLWLLTGVFFALRWMMVRGPKIQSGSAAILWPLLNGIPCHFLSRISSTCTRAVPTPISPSAQSTTAPGRCRFTRRASSRSTSPPTTSRCSTSSSSAVRPFTLPLNFWEGGSLGQGRGCQQVPDWRAKTRYSSNNVHFYYHFCANKQ